MLTLSSLKAAPCNLVLRTDGREKSLPLHLQQWSAAPVADVPTILQFLGYMLGCHAYVQVVLGPLAVGPYVPSQISYDTNM